jgi:hypothetical protein
MKKFKFGFLFLLSLLLFGCTAKKNTEIFRFVNNKYEIYVGESIDLVLVLGPYSEDSVVKYTVSEEGIIELENGIATGLKEGSVEVKATINDEASDTTEVIVKKAEIDGLQILSDKNVVYVGQSLQLDTRIFPSTFSKSVKWEIENNTDNPAAEITANGLLKALRGEETEEEIAAGGIKIRVVATSLENAKVQAKKEFIIKYKDLDTFKLTAPNNKTEFTFEELESIESIQLALDQTPNSYPVISYESSDNTIVLVDEDGILTFPSTLKAGEATITAKALNGKTATIVIKVIQPDEDTDQEE